MMRTLTLLTVLLCFTAPVQAQVEVVRKPPTSVTRTFDPKTPPREMPPLRPGEAAVAESKFLCQVQVEVEISTAPGERPEAKIAAVKAELRLDVVLWLPTDATPKIRAHEEGHKLIAEHFYADAEAAARRIGQKYLGQELEVKSADPAETRPVIQRIANQFCQEYLGAVEVPSEKVQMKYDQLTDHGRNKMSEREAIRRALESVRGTTRPTSPAAAGR